ncbi:DUF1570 domain-containing protein [Brevundimonas staleyi]|uniref:DUF1570 domain-containing protein n=1 Tax=Brevundimonas staleyi TaxID=74326 RepID=A0ABW0FP15_9CAUL
MRLSVSARAILLATALSVCATAPARAEWLRAETEHFIVYGDTSERNIRAYAEKVERFDALLRAYYPIAIDHEVPKLELYMANSAADLKLAEPDIQRSVLGFYAPNSGRIFAVANVESVLSDDVIFHEYAHHFMFQMNSIAYPAWFVEGFAEYYATMRIRDGRYLVGLHQPRRMAALTRPANSWVPMEDVLRWRVSASGRYRGSEYYSVSWALTHYMLSDPARTRALGAYLSAISQGADPIAALDGTINRTPAQLRDDVWRYLSGAITSLTPQIDLPDPSVDVSRMTPNEGRLAWIDLRLGRVDPNRPEPTLEQREGESDRAFAARRQEVSQAFVDERRNLIRDALSASTVNPDDPASVKARARAQRLAGEPQTAIALLEPLIRPDSQDARALRYAAEAWLDLAAKSEGDERLTQIRQARSLLAQSLEIDPLDFLTYLDMDRMRQGVAGYPSENDMATLEVAVALAPQSFDARTRYARVLISRGRPADAVAVLHPVANSPHGGGQRAEGRRLIAQARAQLGLTTAEEAPPEEAEPTED